MLPKDVFSGEEEDQYWNTQVGILGREASVATLYDSLNRLSGREWRAIYKFIMYNPQTTVVPSFHPFHPTFECVPHHRAVGGVLVWREASE